MHLHVGKEWKGKGEGNQGAGWQYSNCSPAYHDP